MTNSYKSKYCTEEKLVTPAQYLAELMCERSARQKKVDLPDRFWRNKKWNQVYRRHIVQLNRLLQRFPVNAVLRAFHDPRTQDFLSFGNKRFIPIIVEHAKELRKLEERELHVTTIEDQVSTPRKPMSRKSVLSKLREIDEQKPD